MPVAVLKPDAASAAGGTQIYYVFADHNNTPRVMTSAANGGVVWRWDNADPFGLVQPNENPGGQGSFVYNARFPGQLFDKETNTHYNCFRDYDPQTGRYVQSDPIGLKGGINTYAYVGGNPLSFVDSFGLAIDCKVVGKFGLFNVEKCQETGEAPSEQYAKDAKRMSDNKLEKACKNNSYDDAHDMKRKMGLDSKSDIFKDKNGNMYSGARQGSRVPEYLNMNIYGK